MDASLVWTVCFVTGTESPYIAFSLKPALHGHPDNMDILHAPLSLFTKFDYLYFYHDEVCLESTTFSKEQHKLFIITLLN